MRIENVYYVNLYLIDRAYGGSEEGGWWFDYGEFIEPAAMFTIEDEAYAFARKMNENTQLPGGLNYGRPSVSSVNSQGEYSFMVQSTPGEDFPSTRPHYE